MSDHAPKSAAIAYPAVREENGQLSLCFDNVAIQSRMLVADPAQLVLECTRLMMGFLLFQPAPARIAMIGLGGGSLAKYCRLKLPDADFTAVEISPEVIALREAFLIPADDERFRVLCADGADYVRNTGEPLDVLLVDGFDRGGQPEQLCSAAFYDACAARLDDRGVLVVDLHSDEPGYPSCLERIRAAFGGKILVIEADESMNTIVFAATGAQFPPAFNQLVERLRQLEAAHPVRLDLTVQKVLKYREPRPSSNRRRVRDDA